MAEMENNQRIMEVKFKKKKRKIDLNSNNKATGTWRGPISLEGTVYTIFFSYPFSHSSLPIYNRLLMESNRNRSSTNYYNWLTEISILQHGRMLYRVLKRP